MAENKEITTLHPYLNRNKNRYPNVKDENIPDTIQRKMTAGTGINISPDNVISATGGDSYTRSETDALLETKADKTALNNAEKVIPTDIAVKNGKIGLEHDATWLTNQNAITLGDGLTYDETTKTLKASGGAALSVQTISPSRANIIAPSGSYKAGDNKILFTPFYSTEGYDGETIIIEPSFISYAKNGALILFYQQEIDINRFRLWFNLVFTKDTTLSSPIELFNTINRYYIPRA